MARFLLISLCLLCSSFASAATQIIFAQDGTKATVTMMALTQNADAIAFYDALNVPIEDMNGKLTKKAAYVDPQGVQAFSAVCAFSKVAPGTGSCVLVFNKSQNLRMEPSRKAIALSVAGADAAKVGKFFVNGDADGTLFRSSDSHFTVVRSGAGADRDLVSFEYR